MQLESEAISECRKNVGNIAIFLGEVPFEFSLIYY